MTKRIEAITYLALNVAVILTGMLEWITGRASGSVTVASVLLALLVANIALGAGLQYRKRSPIGAKKGGRRRLPLWLGIVLSAIGLGLGAWGLMNSPVDLESAGFGILFLAQGVWLTARSANPRRQP
jgi:hypothetical protein